MTSKVTALVADDEKTLREYMCQQLQAVWPELHIIAQAENGIQAVELFEQHQPDICFLDIKMPGQNGLQVAQMIQESTHPNCQVVFATAYDEFAIQAFENAAIDYLVKPITQERLKTTVKRLQNRLDKPEDQSAALSALVQHLQNTTKKKAPLKWIRAHEKNEVHLIAIDDILYFQSADKYTSVYTKDKEFLVRTALKELESQLDADMFWRIHRSTIVQVGHIKTVSKDEFGHMSVSLQESAVKLSVSRHYQALFKSN